MNNFPRVILEQPGVIEREMEQLGFRERSGDVARTVKVLSASQEVRKAVEDAMEGSGCEVVIPLGLGEDDLLVRGRTHQILAGVERLRGARAEIRIAGEEIDRSIQGHQRTRYEVPLPRGDTLVLDRPRLVGILNVTPDSFSDGGRHLDPKKAVEAGVELSRAGADIIDVGGESTRPGAEPVSAEVEMERVVPVVEALAREVAVPISVDTYKASVAEAAVTAGAQIVNDISALRFDEAMPRVVSSTRAALVLMHMQGTPGEMQRDPTYVDVVSEVYRFLGESLRRAEAHGIPRERIIVDPGIGFGKRQEHNLALLLRLEELRSLSCPILVGPSRKSFIGNIVGKPPAERLFGTAASVALAVKAGALLLRVHDVREMKDVADVSWAISRAQEGSRGKRSG